MRTTMAALLAITLAAAMAARAAADDATALAGIWTLDTRASDDPVRVLRDGDHGDGIGRRVARGVSIFGIPVGSLPRSAGDEPVEPDEDLRGVEHVFESTHRLSIEQQTEATQIRYGNALATTIGAANASSTRAQSRPLNGRTECSPSSTSSPTGHASASATRTTLAPMSCTGPCGSSAAKRAPWRSSASSIGWWALRCHERCASHTRRRRRS